MPALTFSKWSCGGNTTLFLHDVDAPPERQTAWARAALAPDVLGAEQAGTVSLSRRSLRMVGGEFCVNASRAFGALLALDSAHSDQNPLQLEISVSGWQSPVSLTVRGRKPCWEVAARLDLPSSLRPEAHGRGCIVRLPGISHLLLPLEDAPLPADLLSEAQAALLAAGLADEAAAGVVWWRPTPLGASMTPVVQVPAAGTLVAEQACGSGALALALELARRSGLRCCQLSQPSGSSLKVSLSIPAQGALEAEISGAAKLLALGRVWLDAKDDDH